MRGGMSERGARCSGRFPSPRRWDGHATRCVVRSHGEVDRGPCSKDDPSPRRMLEVLGEDYQHYVGGTLDGLKPSSRLEVGRCILVAQGWSETFELAEIEDANVELWTYPAPAEWAGPGKRTVVVDSKREGSVRRGGPVS